LVWSTKDNWVQEREKYKAKLEQKILSKLGESHVKAITKQLEDVDRVSEKAYDIIFSGVVEPNSFEGMVNALIRLEKFRFEARKDVAIRLAEEIKGGVREDGMETPKPTYSKTAVRKAAMELIKSEQAELKKE